MQTRKIIIARGIPGSGKSTWARAWVGESPETRIRINNDDIRNMLGDYWVPSREDLVSFIKHKSAVAAMGHGYDIVVDNMNLNPKEINFWETIVNSHNKDTERVDLGFTKYKYEIEFKDFFIPVEECIKRDAMRPNPIGEKTIREIWKKYRHFIQTTAVEKYVNNMRAFDLSKPNCVVIDMDSTMCFNMSKRPWYGKGSTEMMLDDVPNVNMVKLLQIIHKYCPVIVCTGRDTSQKEVTKQWLAKYDIFPTKIYMRQANDFRKGVEIKEELINQILEEYNIIAIFEDSEPIVQKLRDMGLTVLQPNKGI